jgi:hypothetical protein
LSQYKCFECNSTAQHAHHVVPRKLGGTRTIPLCLDCHGKVHDRNMSAPVLIKNGLDRAKAAGKILGCPIKLNREQVSSLRRSGMSLSGIAKEVGGTKSGVSKVLKQLRDKDVTND